MTTQPTQGDTLLLISLPLDSVREVRNTLHRVGPSVRDIVLRLDSPVQRGEPIWRTVTGLFPGHSNAFIFSDALVVAAIPPHEATDALAGIREIAPKYLWSWTLEPGGENYRAIFDALEDILRAAKERAYKMSPGFSRPWGVRCGDCSRVAQTYRKQRRHALLFAARSGWKYHAWRHVLLCRGCASASRPLFVLQDLSLTRALHRRALDAQLFRPRIPVPGIVRTGPDPVRKP